MKAVLLALAIAICAAAPAAAQDPAPTPTPTPTPAPEPRIAPGVSTVGVDLSNLTIPEATAKLDQLVPPVLTQPILVSVAGHHFTLKPKKAKFAFDAERTAKRAYYAGLNAPPAEAPQGGGTAPGVTVPLAVSFRRAVVRDFAQGIAKSVYLAPHDATLKITLKRMVRRHSRSGRAFDVKAARAALEAALADPRIPRVMTPGRKIVKAAVDANGLAKKYPTVITVDKAHFKLRLFKHLKLSKTYSVAVGQPAYPTPSGLFNIQNKQVNPTWSVPNSPWAGELAGQSISGSDPNNPLKARWMGIANGVGIHGTGQDWSIGSRASHGCIRMHVSDVIDLYPRVPVGTPVLIQ